MSTQAHALPTTAAPNYLLRSLQANYVLSFLNGVLFIVAANPVGRWMGLPNPAVLLPIGILFVGYAAFVYYTATRPVPNPALVMGTVVGDSSGFVACLLLLLTNWVPLSTAGYGVIIFIAVVVDIFATLQFMGWRRLTA